MRVIVGATNDTLLPPLVSHRSGQWGMSDIGNASHIATATDGRFLYVHMVQGALMKFGTGGRWRVSWSCGCARVCV